ncbi:MAG TPA: (2Fe-2S)-binding protein [Gammaproteobacteria bacterium]|nr:(2Fe-2S)-binding protein [Gammaproteobacteria bacterium]
MASSGRYKQLETFYCLCSESGYQEILQRQKNHPLAFHQFLEEHTRCHTGCGSCIENLHTYLAEAGCLIE